MEVQIGRYYKRIMNNLYRSGESVLLVHSEISDPDDRYYSSDVRVYQVTEYYQDEAGKNMLISGTIYGSGIKSRFQLMTEEQVTWWAIGASENGD